MGLDIHDATQLAKAITDLIDHITIPVSVRKLVDWTSNQIGIPIIMRASASFLSVKQCSGAAVWGKGSYWILYNRNEPKERQRFTIAHEVGHIWQAAEHDFLKKDEEDRNEERHANVFAAAFLMPEDLVREEMERRRLKNQVLQRYYLAQRFIVSPSAMGFRLRNLGIE